MGWHSFSPQHAAACQACAPATSLCILCVCQPVSALCVYSTSPWNGNPVNGNHLDQSLSFSQKNGNSLTWVLVAWPVCPTSPLRLRDSAEPRPNLELASGNDSKGIACDAGWSIGKRSKRVKESITTLEGGGCRDTVTALNLRLTPESHDAQRHEQGRATAFTAPTARVTSPRP